MLNEINLIGRVTKEIEVKKTQKNKSFIHFTLAIDNGKDRDSSFIECQAWEGRAETIAKWVKKGDMLHVSGELINKNYENKEGVNVYTYVVNVNGFTLLPNSRKESVETPAEEQPQKEQPAKNGKLDIESDDLPFY